MKYFIFVLFIKYVISEVIILDPFALCVFIPTNTENYLRISNNIDFYQINFEDLMTLEMYMITSNQKSRDHTIGSDLGVICTESLPEVIIEDDRKFMGLYQSQNDIIFKVSKDQKLKHLVLKNNSKYMISLEIDEIRLLRVPEITYSRS